MSVILSATLSHAPQTNVGFNQFVVHQDIKVFGEDVGNFRPDRWLKKGDTGDMGMCFVRLGYIQLTKPASSRAVFFCFCIGNQDLSRQECVVILVCAVSVIKTSCIRSAHCFRALRSRP